MIQQSRHNKSNNEISDNKFKRNKSNMLVKNDSR